MDQLLPLQFHGVSISQFCGAAFMASFHGFTWCIMQWETGYDLEVLMGHKGHRYILIWALYMCVWGIIFQVNSQYDACLLLIVSIVYVIIMFLTVCFINEKTAGKK